MILLVGAGFAVNLVSDFTMKIFFLYKQRYMSHDVIQDRYGRLYHLSNELSLLGHDVYCSCLSYRKNNCHEVHREKSDQAGQLSWGSIYAGRFGYKLPQYIRKLSRDISSIEPDVIMASSDVLHTIIARRVGHETNTPYFLDLYDNYESFGMCKIPGMLNGYHKALREADGIFTVSNTLRDYICRIAPAVVVTTIESTISEGTFASTNQTEAIIALNLPQDKLLIGTAGSLSKNRGTEYLYQAFTAIKKKYPAACLVLAGPVEDNPPPVDPDILYLGQRLTQLYQYSSML
jgi:glycosyltransferase involved in cell wall biosynthesis